MRETKKRYRATAIVPFPGLDNYLAAIVDSIATHDMAVDNRDGIYEVSSPFGRAQLEAGEGSLRLAAEAADAAGLNRLKHALVGPIAFITAKEMPHISWTGDRTEPTLPDDLRILHVIRTEDLSPRLRRVTFRGANLDRYDRKDQLHCRLIFQERGTIAPKWPMLDDNGHVVWPDDAKIPTRVYTIRHIDLERQEIAIDFALHDNPGPATRWAMNARRDDLVGMLGPAGNGPKEANFYVLAGDETALPGIARILEALPSNSTGHAFIEVGSHADELALLHPAGMSIRWLHRNGATAGTTALLETAVKTVSWPQDLQGALFWGGCEHKAFSSIYRHLRREIGLDRDRLVFYSHWHRSLSEEGIIARGAEAYLPTDPDR
ncbi:Siderophore-interacting protein [Rhizobium sp. CF080]|uniref:siderophore-interacting protein n=1 Tax=Rhizobium sp. (strain CF080) TaxID=1144310 RepID=UPI0003E7DB93|nr:siderophore-interacting protein [Rhizobium sp. CF080]EUB99228.1 Siderophore-interacting protein [Rhizobium sp. CF080]